uniref:Innexin n=1 Tax=Globodera rostochiensis TaxID=31243 RepID=A0A914I9G5_GLORO
MKPLIDTVFKYIGPSKVKLDDFVDRLCYRYTPVLLGLFMFITGTVDNFGSPINCMVPQEFSSTWSSFVHQYCYVTGTYLKIEHPVDQHPSGRVFVHYYQWVPYVLILQALFMRLPLSFWRFGRRMSDADFDYVNELGVKARTSTTEKRKELLSEAANYIYQVLSLFLVVNARHTHNGLGSLASYIYLLKVFVGYNSWKWGLTLLTQSWSNVGETNFTYFPRVAYCQFERDFLGQPIAGIQQEARCTLGINMLNEKVFLFLFFWYYLLFALTLVNAIVHSQRLLSAYRVNDVRYLLSFGTNIERKNSKIAHTHNACGDTDLTLEVPAKRHHLSFSATSTPSCRGTWSSSGERSQHFVGRKMDGHVVSRFVDECLGQDGYLLLRCVSQNSGKLVAAELTVHLFELMSVSG